MAPVAPSSSSPLRDRSILVTGGTGTFGYAFVRRALADGARKVVVFSRGEAKQAEMRAAISDPRLHFRIGDVRDRDRLRFALADIEIVAHAAALKRIEVCESDPLEATATNIRGTENVGLACIEAGVKRAILLSTDKAAAPNTHYGSTKLAAERLWNGLNVYAAGSPSRFACTRYGNVTGSTGSVVPLWRSQARSGALTITDMAMTRFFMSIDAAVSLVVLALDEMRGGEVFVPKIGCARLADLATAVAPECGLRIGGIRPSEKLHETLITEDEARSTYDAGTHYVIEPHARSWGDVSPLPFPRVPVGFTYRSDTASALSESELAALVAA